MIAHFTALTTQTPRKNKIYPHISSIFTEKKSAKNKYKAENETENEMKYELQIGTKCSPGREE